MDRIKRFLKHPDTTEILIPCIICFILGVIVGTTLCGSYHPIIKDKPTVGIYYDQN